MQHHSYRIELTAPFAARSGDTLEVGTTVHQGIVLCENDPKVASLQKFQESGSFFYRVRDDAGNPVQVQAVTTELPMDIAFTPENLIAKNTTMGEVLVWGENWYAKQSVSLLLNVMLDNPAWIELVDPDVLQEAHVRVMELKLHGGVSVFTIILGEDPIAMILDMVRDDPKEEDIKILNWEGCKRVLLMVMESLRKSKETSFQSGFPRAEARGMVLDGDGVLFMKEC